MAISVAYGVLFGTIILLIYFLHQYCILMIFKEQKNDLGRKTPPNWSEVEPVIKNIQRVKDLKNK